MVHVLIHMISKIMGMCYQVKKGRQQMLHTMSQSQVKSRIKNR